MDSDEIELIDVDLEGETLWQLGNAANLLI